MMTLKKIFLFFLILITGSFVFGKASDILGYWQIVDQHDGHPLSIVLIYEYESHYYGRMVALYDDKTNTISETLENPKELAKGFEKKTTLIGLDFIWCMKPSEEKSEGKVINPDSGSVYTCESWVDKDSGKLVFEGELLFFYSKEYWLKMDEEKVPEKSRLDPKKIIPIDPMKF